MRRNCIASAGWCFNGEKNCINTQSPITKVQLITNTQYSITKQELSVWFPVWVFGHWLLGINW